MSRRYEKLPENINQFSDQEIDAFAQKMWQRISAERKLINRETQLHLRQLAYSIWINKYPGEKDDDFDCHLEEIYLLLVDDYLSQIE